MGQPSNPEACLGQQSMLDNYFSHVTAGPVVPVVDEKLVGVTLHLDP